MTKMSTRAACAAFALAAAAACGGGDGPTGPNLCSTSEDPLDVGQVAILDTGQVAACAFLASENGNAEYLVVPFTASFELAGNFVVTVDGSRVAISKAGSAPAQAESPVAEFHRRLRALEAWLAGQGLEPASPAGPRLLQEPVLFQQDTFWVITSTTVHPDSFVEVGATLRFIGSRTLIYVDDDAPATGGFSDADLAELGQVYNDQLLDVALIAFGDVSDVNGDGRVTILLTPRVNALTPPGSEGVIVGFFFGLDLLRRDQTSLCGELCPFSNEQEIFYGLVPDPTGIHGDPIQAESLKRVLPPVMIHETQHMISFNYHVLLSTQPFRQAEVLWLNEALSHIAEELGGDVIAQTDPDAAVVYYEQNFIRAERYLAEAWFHSLTATEGGGSLEERGAGWLFLRWLGDQYPTARDGKPIFQALVQTTNVGSVNVERRTGAEFFDLFGDWVVVLFTEDLSIPNLSGRYQIDRWALRTLLTSGGSYPLQPVARTFSQLRATGVTQTLKGSSPYHVLVSDDASGDLSLSLDVAGQGGIAILRTN